MIAHTGQIVDASFVECPKQRNSREENEKIKAHETVEGWNKAKRCQKISMELLKKGVFVTLAIKITSVLIENQS